MHAAALDWVDQWAPAGRIDVLDIGGRDINGSPKPLFHEASFWEAVDLIDGPEVTWCGDFLNYCPDRLFNVALHLEVAEHCPVWGEHLRHARDCLALGGVLIFTAAGPERASHSAIDGGELRPGEHYQNVDPGELSAVLRQLFRWSTVDVTPDGQDVRAVARRL